jgi:iron donor protein CyaY
MAMDDQEFRRHAESAIEDLKRSLLAAETEADFEVEEQAGVLNVVFEEPPGKFVITPNAPVRQIWISALATSFKLNWENSAGHFVLAKTGEALKPLVARLVNEQLGTDVVRLD